MSGCGKDPRPGKDPQADQDPQAEVADVHAECHAHCQEILHDLDVHQLELKMQNEQLRLSELKLAEARDRYFDLFDLAPMAYLTVDRAGVIVEANFATSNLLGRERATVLGRKLASFVSPEDAAPFHLFQESMYETGTRQVCQLFCLRPEGEAVRVRMQGISLADNDSVRAFASIAIVDLSEIERAEKKLASKSAELQRTEDRLESFMGATSDCVLVLSEGGIITAVNPPTLALLGGTKEELLGRHISSLDHGEVPKLGSAVQSTEVVWTDHDGHPHTVRLAISPILSGDGTEFLCTARDITARKEAEKKLQTSERLLRQMAETIDDGFYVRESPNGEFSYVSPAFEQIFGHRRKEFYDQPDLVMGLVHPSDAKNLAAAYARFQKGAPCDEQYRVIRGDGETRWVRERAFPVTNRGGSVGRIVGIAQDVTDQRQLELELRQAQKMEAIGQLASGVAHDFNNILMGIHGCASIGLSKLSDTSEVRPFLEAIRKSSESGTAIIKQLLVFSSKRELEIRTFDLGEMLLDDEIMLARLLGDTVILNVAPAEEECMVHMDMSQVEQILMNLAINARDAMPDGGELLVETGLSDEAGASDNQSTRGKFVVLRVRDSGTGMSEEVRERIFEPFFTTKDIGEGTGLGLSTVYGIVQEAGGFIRCESEVGVGTAFSVYLPRAEEGATEDAGNNRHDSDPGSDGEGTTVLVVEDEATVRLATRLYLESEGYTVLEAGSGAEAIRILNTYETPIHLLLTDVGLPGFSGAGLAARARELNTRLPVIFMSAHASSWLVEQGRLAEGEQTLEKPFSKRELLNKVFDVLAASGPEIH